MSITDKLIFLCLAKNITIFLPAPLFLVKCILHVFLKDFPTWSLGCTFSVVLLVESATKSAIIISLVRGILERLSCFTNNKFHLNRSLVEDYFFVVLSPLTSSILNLDHKWTDNTLLTVMTVLYFQSKMHFYFFPLAKKDNTLFHYSLFH